MASNGMVQRIGGGGTASSKKMGKTLLIFFDEAATAPLRLYIILVETLSFCIVSSDFDLSIEYV
ncbi:MAG: hypothetical protein EHM41_04770 [Chloroflexi bacterium]|nr:MAG: hypothetical protein EHM41_04770 [Chloroflexota bacterium]